MRVRGSGDTNSLLGSNHIFLTGIFPHQIGITDQNQVPRMVTKGVVHVLELIDIRHNDGQRLHPVNCFFEYVLLQPLALYRWLR